MSLINKMLRDLESRQQQAPNATPSQRPVYQDLKPAAKQRVGGVAPVVLVLVGIGVATVAGYYAWDAWRSGAFAPVATASAPASSPAAASVKVAAAPVVAHPSPVSTVIPEPPPATAAVAPAAAAPEAPPPPVVASAPGPVGLAPTPAAPSAPVATANASDTTAQRPAPKSEPSLTPSPTRSVVAKVAKPKSVTPAPDVDRADGSFDKRIRPFTAEEKAESAYRVALRLVDQGRHDEAVQELTQALRASSGHVAARELLVALSLKRGHWREAQRLLEDGMKQSPDRYSFAKLLARIHIDHGADQNALAVLERAAPLAANDAEFKALLATVYQRLGRHAEAIATFSQVTALQPADSRAWLGLGISLEATQKSQPARQAYQRARQMGGLPPSLAKYADQRLAALNGSD